MNDWKQGFHEALVEAIWNKGRVVGANASIYGWADYKLSEHPASCQLKSATSLQEDEWVQFLSTFDGSVERYGVSAKMTCECGKINGQTMRWDEPLGEALMYLLRDAL